ncbi:streptomycin biosynthesis protein StrI [Polychytrium aggregatum]|uniref:streptomycin biosynthesis protein StrI n=1 Tax=Polychytrium aggregatum TaxID=110093 RepID=UPI0022FEC89C|nr:streptomycin biosynthesis protein StrI [Polychytrium aggregatum]KAI9203113.1 streptomycin biosynthesis protein StrI [Polychytrium aggregatum]
MAPLTLAVLGAGERGNIFGNLALQHPERVKVVAVAEVHPSRRSIFASKHSIADASVFSDWRALAEQPKLADAVVITTLDRMHYEATILFAQKGYHILCEKPLATDPNECAKMVKAVQDAGVILAVGHVLRYSPYFVALKKQLDNQAVGDILNMIHVEPVGNYHFAHSFVRGNWGRKDLTSFSLMTKSCHDLDIICHMLSPRRPLFVSSFGSLTHFRKDKKPKEAGDAKRCQECAYEPQCPYSTNKIYMDTIKGGHKGWPVSVLHPEPDIENIAEALRTGPYGRCVYECDNDVNDHQVVNIEFEGGVSVSFTMVATTQLLCQRLTRIHGSLGEITGDMNIFDLFSFQDRQNQTHHPSTTLGGHGGGDDGLFHAFVEALEKNDQSVLGCTPNDILTSHLLVFAAESARLSRTVVDFNEFASTYTGLV